MTALTIPTHSWVHQRKQLESFARDLDPAARLEVKHSRLWIGGLRTNATTLGRTVYIPQDWSVDDVTSVIPHEVSGHVKQFRWCGLGIHPVLGIFPGMALVYLWGVILPVLLAWGRYRCELHAETVSWRYHLEHQIWNSHRVRDQAKRFAAVVSSSAYAWAWPKRWTLRGFEKRAKKVIAEQINKLRSR